MSELTEPVAVISGPSSGIGAPSVMALSVPRLAIDQHD
jgi:NADP-dependent 3-hydroxy acid dehydrogenase YdfG